MEKKYLYIYLFAAVLLFNHNSSAQVQNEIILNSDKKGIIPAWLVSGPIEFPTIGFGQAKDTVAIGEPNISPSEGDYANSNLPEKEKTSWILQSVDEKDFIDFNKTIEWNVNPLIPQKIWYAKAGYAFTTIISEIDREVILTLGSNSQIAVYLNGIRIHENNNIRNAVQDQDSIKIKLKKGSNDLVVRVVNTQQNLGLFYFGMIKWQWGFYARIVDQNARPIAGLKYLLKTKTNKTNFNAYSTFYFKKINNELKQRIDVDVNSKNPEMISAGLMIKLGNRNYKFRIDSVRFGRTKHSIYVPELKQNEVVEAVLNLPGETVRKNIELQRKKKYDLHLMLLNHTDIGYTNPQPVCEELHCITIDSVIKMCKDNPDFNWTIENTWQMEAYEKLRDGRKFQELIKLIKEGRIAVSPIYANPFTGYVSEEEMLRSFDKAVELKNKYGISYVGAVYNDVPGQSWFLPQALSKAGVKLIAEGINEVYGDYKLQRSLPKIFKWEASDKSQVVTYLNEAYNEGKNYGLESGDLYCVEQRIWECVNKLEGKNYQPEVILINSSFSDNSILASHQYRLAMKWNEEYEYPKFISSNINIFSNALIKSQAYKELPVLRGDWTSKWEIISQGEFERHKMAREIQHNLLSAEKISTLSSLLDKTKLPMNSEISESYRSLLQFSGHGSGLEYGYGSPEENKLTMMYRQNYVDNAFLGAEAVLLKGMTQISKPEESLESEGLFLFNTLSWKRNDLVEINFPFDKSPAYDVIDAVTGNIVPSFRKDHRQYFVAKDVPSFGYKKFLLKNKAIKKENAKEGLVKTNNSIENSFYKISFDSISNSLMSIVDKKSGHDLLNKNSAFQLGVPIVEKLNQDYSTLAKNKITFQIIDESPVRLTLRINRGDDAIESLGYSLVEGIDKVFYNATVNLALLKATNVFEEYGLPFNFNEKDAQIKSEILGGFIDQNKDRLPGNDHDGVSLRRSVSIFNRNENIIWSSEDARIIRIRKDSTTNEQTIISNPINNFPDSWNRHENKDGKIEFRYAFTAAEGSFNAAKTTMFGYELSTPILVRKSWFKSSPSSEEFLSIDNKNIILLNLKSVAQGNLLRLINADIEDSQTAIIHSNFITGLNASAVDIWGNKLHDIAVENSAIKVILKPGEFVDILINK